MASLLLVVWLVGGYFVIVNPKTNRLSSVDAILVLGSPDRNGRQTEGLELLDAGRADTLIESVGSNYQRSLKSICSAGVTGKQVVCFLPEPATTQGEAREIAALSKQHGWTRIIVVTSTYHVSRARMIVERCFDGKVEMAAARKGISLGDWAYQYVYQTGAYLKAFLKPGC
ncbi:YdcF family protein [Jatrophihabitans sp. DSM 45814]